MTNTKQTADPNSVPRLVTPEQTVRELSSLVDEFELRYRELLDSIEAHDLAMRTADAKAMAECVRRENEAIQAIAQLDKKRAEIVALHRRARGESVDGSASTVTAVARSIGGAAGGKLAERAEGLRALVENVRARAAVVREAAQMLSTHTDGIMRQAVQMLNQAQVYSRGGSVKAGPAVASALDITS